MVVMRVLKRMKNKLINGITGGSSSDTFQVVLSGNSLERRFDPRYQSYSRLSKK